MVSTNIPLVKCVRNIWHKMQVKTIAAVTNTGISRFGRQFVIKRGWRHFLDDSTEQLKYWITEILKWNSLHLLHGDGESVLGVPRHYNLEGLLHWHVSTSLCSLARGHRHGHGQCALECIVHAAYVPSYECIEGSVCQVTVLMAKVTCCNSGHWINCNREGQGRIPKKSWSSWSWSGGWWPWGGNPSCLSARLVAAQVTEGSG